MNVLKGPFKNVLILLLSLCCPFADRVVYGADFVDVPDDAWYKPYVDDLCQRGIIEGKTEITFAPDDTITRAELAKIMATASQEDLATYEGGSPFSDITADSWYAPYVAWAADKQIVNGVGNNRFEPNREIERQELAVMLGRYSRYQGYNALPKVKTMPNFKDSASIAAWAKDDIVLLARADLLNGYGDDTLVPAGKTPRREAVKLVSVFLDMLENGYQGRTEVMILLYHNLVASASEAEADTLYSTTGEKFRQDLQTLLDLGFESLSLEEYYYANYDKTKDYFIVNFDDGYASNYTIAYPVMHELGVKGDIFLVTESVYTVQNKLQYDMIEEMEASGNVMVYSHLPYHKSATELSATEFYSWLLKSYQTLEDNLSKSRLRILAYPNGHYSQETCEIALALDTALQMVQDKPALNNPYGLLNRLSVKYNSDMRRMAANFLNLP